MSVPVELPPLSARLGATLRALRRRADLSQRELARRARVPDSTIARLESERGGDAWLSTLDRIFEAAGARLTVVTSPGHGTEILPIEDDGQLRDGAERRHPPHLDLRTVEKPEDWWGAWWAHDYPIPQQQWPITSPDYTFDLDRRKRNRRRYGYADPAEFYDYIDVDED